MKKRMKLIQAKGKRFIKKSITSSGQIEALDVVKLSLNTSYYYNSILVETDDVVKKGEKNS